MRRTALAPLLCIALTVAGCSDSGKDKKPTDGRATTTSATQSVADENSAIPPASVVKQWPAKWCQAQIGWTRDQMRQLMGTPTDEFGPESGTPQMNWYAFEFGFSAFFDIDDKVRQLDINDIQLSADEKAALKCDTTRTGG